MMTVMELGFQDVDDDDDVASWRLQCWALIGLIVKSWDQPLRRNPRIYREELEKMMMTCWRKLIFPGNNRKRVTDGCFFFDANECLFRCYNLYRGFGVREIGPLDSCIFRFWILNMNPCWCRGRIMRIYFGNLDRRLFLSYSSIIKWEELTGPQALNITLAKAQSKRSKERIWVDLMVRQWWDKRWSPN